MDTGKERSLLLYGECVLRFFNQQDGVLKTKINRHHDVKYITWMPSSKGNSSLCALGRLLSIHLGFLSVEGSGVVHLGLTGNEIATYMFDNMELHDVAVTPDEQRLLGVGTLVRSPCGLNPRMSKEEKRIVGMSPPPPISLPHMSEQRPSVQH